MLSKTKDDKELESLVNEQRKDLVRLFEENYKIQEQTLSVIINGKNHADYKQMESNGVFWNAAGFINITSFDLKVIVKEMTLATNEWSKRYFARQACHLIYELTNDLYEVIGKDFKKQIDKLTDNESLGQSLIGIKQRLNLFKDKYFVKLKEIRNVSSAHRDKDILKQLGVIESINWIETISMVSQFDNIMNDLGAVMQTIIKRSSIELDK